jgi:hypothetical protein
MPKIGGDFFVGFLSDQSRYGFRDYNGDIRGASKSLFSGVDSPHDFHLTVNANLAGGVKFIGDLVDSNYVSSVGGLGNIAPHLSGANSAPEVTTIYQAELSVPLTSFGSHTTLELGRFKNELTPLTYYRPDADVYFNLPWYDDGQYVEDGFKLTSKFGSATTQIFAGSYTDLTTNTGGIGINAPIVGTANSAGIGNPTFANQSAGLHVALPLFKMGEVGLTLLDFSDTPTTTGGAGFGNEVIYGANVRLNPIGRFMISAEAAKSVTQADISHGDGSSNETTMPITCMWVTKAVPSAFREDTSTSTRATALRDTGTRSDRSSTSPTCRVRSFASTTTSARSCRAPSAATTWKAHAIAPASPWAAASPAWKPDSSTT